MKRRQIKQPVGRVRTRKVPNRNPGQTQPSISTTSPLDVPGRVAASTRKALAQAQKDKADAVDVAIKEQAPFYGNEFPLALQKAFTRVRDVLRRELAPAYLAADDAFAHTVAEYGQLVADGLNVDLDAERKLFMAHLGEAANLKLLKVACESIGLSEKETDILVAAHIAKRVGASTQGQNQNGGIVSQLFEVLNRLPKSKERP